MKIMFFFPEAGSPKGAGDYSHYNLRAPLIKLGHEIIDFDFWEEEKKLGKEMMLAKVKEIVEKERPHIFYHGIVEEEFDVNLADYIRDYTETTSMIWFSDDDWRFEHSMRWADHYSFAFTTCKEAFREFHARGYDNVILSQWGCNTDLYHPIPSEKLYDVTFVGQPYKGRTELIAFLKEHGVSVRVWGQGWENFSQLRDIAHGYLPHQKMLEVFSASKIVLGMAWCSFDGKTPQIKGRTFEYPACKAFQLTNYDKRVLDYFTEKEEIVFYNDKKDLLDKIRYYLAHEDERNFITEAAYGRAVKDHTWEKRYELMFKEMTARSGKNKLPLVYKENVASISKVAKNIDHTPKISVISYVYNYGNYLKELIPSVLNQTFKDIEFLILDDGSTDNTKEVVESFCYDQRLKYVYQDNIGKDNRFNELIERGLQLTKGEFVNFVGGDDVFMPDKLERQMKEFEKTPYLDIVFSDLFFIDDRGRVLPGDYKSQESVSFNKGTLARMLFKINFIAHPTVLMKRACIDAMGGFERWWCADLHFWLKSAPFLNFKFIDEKLIKYRIHDKGASTSAVNADITFSETNNMLQVMRSKYTIIDLYPEINYCINRAKALYSAYVELGNNMMLAKIPQVSLAVDEYRRALEHEPKGVEAINNIGLAFFLLGDRKKFIEFFQYLKDNASHIEIIRANIVFAEQMASGKQGEVKFTLLNELIENNEFVRAKKMLNDEHLKTMMSNIQNLNNGKESYRKSVYEETEKLSGEGKYAEAAAKLETLFDSFPDNSTLWNDLGVLYYYADETGCAVGYIEKALQLDPGNLEAKKNLANIYLETGKCEMAIDMFYDILKEHPDDAEVLSITGDVLKEIGREVDAVGFYERVLKLEPHNVRAQECLERLNNVLSSYQ